MSGAPRPDRLATIALSIVLAAGGAGRAARAGDGPSAGSPAPSSASAPWELEVEHEMTDQDRLLDEARQRQALGSVVMRYQSRAGRDPSALNHFLLGRAQYYNSDVPGAKAQMEAALEADPKFWPAHLKLGQLFQILKASTPALEHLNAVLVAKPGHKDALKLSAVISIERKDWDRALRVLDELESRFPGDPEVRRQIVSVRVEKKDWEPASRELRTLRSMEPANAEVRVALGWCLLQKGDVDAAIVELEDASKASPQSLAPLDVLERAYAVKKDWAHVQTTLERMLPLLPPEKQKQAAMAIDELKKGPPVDRPEGEERQLTAADLFKQVGDADPEKRRDALRTLFEGVTMGYVKEGPWNDVLLHVSPHAERDVTCRQWAVKLCAFFDTAGIFYLGSALEDSEREVRMLAIEELGDSKRPAGIAYLTRLLEQTDDVAEFNALRSALTSLTGYHDLPETQAVVSAADVTTARDAWRRWRLSDGSRDAKVAAIRDVLSVGGGLLEWYLVVFVKDETFDVMKEGYSALLKVTQSKPANLIERTMYPRFPKVADGELTRANMRSIQDKVGAWWLEWIAEHKAIVREQEREHPEKDSPK